ncbi:MAG TPA: HD domain-containing protein [Bacteroidales bacterium]|nr:HD domain-containing protein [Bacteroidales bacterium]HPS51064.1 HD domain-containing protein [Bacteroidales bacterium]
MRNPVIQEHIQPETAVTFKKYLKNPVFKVISGVAEESGTRAFVIGGFVRDLILKRDNKQDIDIVVLGSGIEFANRVASKLEGDIPVKFFRNFGTAMFNYQGYQFEFVGARKESYRLDSRKPIVENGTLEDDQNRRDFTINAMAIELTPAQYGSLIDPFNGIGDLKQEVIRTPLDPDVTFSDDPLRMMRAIRFATQLGFSIDPVCLEAIRRNAHRISIVSMERVSDELNLIIEAPVPSAGFRLLDDTGLLQLIFPEFCELKGTETIEGKGHKDNFAHTLAVLDNIATVSDNLWLRWAALLHDIAKPATRKFIPGTGWTFHTHEFRGAKMVPGIFRKLKLPLNEKMKYVQKLVQLHLRPIVLAEDVVTDSAVRRLLFEAGDDIDDLMTLCNADITSKNPQKVKRYISNFILVRQKLKDIEEKDRLRNWQPPISGEIIMAAFQIQPSKQVGIIKDAITEAILEGIIPNEYEAAYKFMIDEGEKLGLKKIVI